MKYMAYSKIVLAGKRCAGKTTLFWSLQKELNWPMFSISQYLRDIIRIKQLTPEQVENMSSEVTQDIDKRVLALTKAENNVVIEGRIFGMLQKPIPGTLRVLLYAADWKRIERSALREKITEEKARQRLFKKEEELLQRMQKIYNCPDFYKYDFYDLIIDTTHLTPQQILQAVLHKVNE